MSKVYIYAAGAFVAGLAAGALATWKFANEKAKADFDEKLESVRNDYKDLYSRIMVSEDKPSDEPKDANDEKKVEITQKDVNTYELYAGTYDKNVDYTSYSKDNAVEESSSEEDEDDSPDIYRNDPSRPRVISDEEYYDEPDMNKLSICLFEDDENPVLTDDAWDPLEEPYKVITKEDLEMFLAQDDVDEIFTVCEARNCMYSIEKQGQNWDTFLKHNPIIIETGY